MPGLQSNLLLTCCWQSLEVLRTQDPGAHWSDRTLASRSIALLPVVEESIPNKQTVPCGRRENHKSLWLACLGGFVHTRV